MEKSAELLFEKKRAQELNEEKKDFDTKYQSQQEEIDQFKRRVNKEVKALRDKCTKLTTQN